MSPLGAAGTNGKPAAVPLDHITKSARHAARYRRCPAVSIRVKCASLPWHAVRAALDSRDEVVSTE
jgi:hypothetical protein